MEQKFTKTEGDKIKWEYFKEDEAFEDKEFGKVGTKGGYDYIIFDSKEQAQSVLDRDINEVEQFVDKFKTEMDKNEHSLDKFSDLKELVDSIGKLHNDFKEVSNENVQKLYADNPKKYQKLLREFNTAKDYIKDELASISSEYQKYLDYNKAKKSYDFNVEQLNKIKEQKEKLLEL